MKQTGTAFQRYILPGLIFQSVIISGGYGTGAEVTGYFLAHGPMGGLLGLCLVTFPIWAVLCTLTFSFALRFSQYEYKGFFRRLLGPFWVGYDLCYLGSLVLSLAVISAAAGNGMRALFGAPYGVGVAIVGGLIIWLVLGGTESVERFLSCWSYVLYAVYALFLLACFRAFDGIAAHFLSTPEIGDGFLRGGAQYAFYNLGIIPAVLASTRFLRTTKDCIIAGLVAAALATAPAIFLLFALSGLYPTIIDAEVPISAVFAQLDRPWLHAIFQVTLLGTLVETGSGLISAAVNRFEGGGRPRPWLRPIVAGGFVCTGMIVSSFGLSDLVRHGYGTSAWAFLLVYVLPMLTLGVLLLYRARRRPLRK